MSSHQSNDHSTLDPTGAVAIVGMAGRFPGANDVETFWSNLESGVESITFFDPSELDIPPNPNSPDATPTFIAAKGVLDDVDQFDARFFGYLPTEAALMDPQHRVFLENCWEALEHAGYDPTRYDGAIGLYAGCYIDTYLLSNLCTDTAFLRRLIESIQVGTLQTELGNDKDYLATRVSFKLGLRGPSVTLQTACSTSLVAISHAYQSLVTYSCDMALAGGVTITFPMKRGYYYKEGGMLSRDGHCRAFDASAAGTVFSNASAVIVMKRLDEAIADGDTVYAVVRGAATNNDGGAKLSYTAPSVEGQAEVIALAHAVADISARTIDYVECHGTATPLGDPIEVEGLTKAFRATTDDVQFCAIGSVKTNVGHLDVASGVTGVIKTAMALHHRVLPPSLHFESPNPKIDFDRTPFFVNAQRREWPASDHPRRAGVSSFGVGGTNAHVVLEEAPPAPEVSAPKRGQLLILSAKSETALERQALRLADHLETHPELDLGDVAHTLQVGRQQLDFRRIVPVTSREQAIERLRDRGAPADRAKVSSSAGPLVFMFPGQGSQFPNMAREIYDAEPVFRAVFDRCAEHLRPHIGRDLRELCFVEDRDREAAAEVLKNTTFAQPAIFAVEYALAQLWLEWGLQPSALVGHSVGEFAAACVGGIMSLEDALEVVADRGRLMNEQPSGSMLSVRAAPDQLRAYLTPGLDLAAVNAPALSVVSGPTEKIEELRERLTREDVACSLLHTSHAFHSAMMQPAVAPTVDRVSRMQLSPPSIPIVSTVTGSWITDEEATSAKYWGRNLRDTVNFSQAIQTLLEGEERIFLEVGPGQVSSTLVKQTAGEVGKKPVALSSLGHAQRGGLDVEPLLTALGRLWLAGMEPNWVGVHGGRRKRVALPTYPFERKRHWIEPTPPEVATQPRPEPVAISNGDRGVAPPPVPANPTPIPSSPQRDPAVPAVGPMSAGVAATSGDEMEELIRRQIQLMAEQLALIDGL